jgi:guanylate kinase
VVLVIDVNGAHNVRKSFPNSTLIFLLPPTPKDLRRRLCGRGTECVSDIENRLNIAREEINAVKHYDFLVINDSQEAAVEDLRQIVQVLRIHHIRGNERQAWEENAYEGWHTSGGHDA